VFDKNIKRVCLEQMLKQVEIQCDLMEILFQYEPLVTFFVLVTDSKIKFDKIRFNLIFSIFFQCEVCLCLLLLTAILLSSDLLSRNPASSFGEAVSSYKGLRTFLRPRNQGLKVEIVIVCTAHCSIVRNSSMQSGSLVKGLM